MSSRRKVAKRQWIVDGVPGIEALVQRISRISRNLTPAESWSDIARQAPMAGRAIVDRMIQMMAGRDVFDVIELVRQHEIPMTLSGYKESEGTGLAATMDLIALVAIGIGERHIPRVAPTDDEEPATNLIINDLCQLAHDLMTIASMVGFSLEGKQSVLGPLAGVAGEFRVSELMVRNKHYNSIASQLNGGILEAPKVQQVLAARLGFDYGEICRVNEAVRELYAKGKGALLETMHAAVTYRRESGGEDAVVSDEVRQAFETFFVSPGSSASFTGVQVADRCGLELEKVERILDTFSIGFGGAQPVDAVNAFIEGVNPLVGVAFIRDPDRNYLTLQDGIPVDHIRRSIEAALKKSGGDSWKIYGGARDKFAEGFACDQLGKLLGEQPTYRALKYLAPPDRQLECDLSRDAINPSSYADQCEADALLVIDDVAVCLEVKAGSIRDKARQGNVQRMTDDLNKTIGSATNQARRIESVILKNGGLWRRDGKWIDLSGVREVRSVVACLDDFGPVSIAQCRVVKRFLGL